MARYIDADKFEQTIKGKELFQGYFDNGFIYDELHRQPTADVAEVKRGYWKEDGEYQICSVCGEEHHWDEYRATYCEDCGAKMDGGIE
jgi:hypothetical protein